MLVLVSSIVSAATLERTLSTTQVNKGGTLTITYHQSESKSYGLIQDIPLGWTTSEISPDGKHRAYIDSGQDYTLTLTAPNQDITSNFVGEYFVYPATTYTNFNLQSISVAGGGNGVSEGFALGGMGLLVIAGLAVYFLFIRKK